MIKKIIASASALLLLAGCSTSSQEYYNAVNMRNAQYMEAYTQVENETVKFNGEFKGDITIVKPKDMPQLQMAAQPKTNTDRALQWASVLAPSLVGIAGMHYNFRSNEVQSAASRDIAISNNEMQSSVFGSYSSNYKNDNAVSDTTVNSTSVSDISNTTTQEVPTINTTDGTNTVDVN